MAGKHIRTTIGTGVCLSLGLSLAVTLGAVPQGTSSRASAEPIARVVKVASAALQTPERVASYHSTAPVKHPKKKHHPKKTTHVKKAPRVTPSASALSGAVTGLKQYVHTIFSITTSEVAQFGDQVCTAFDQNKSYSQIKSEITAKVKQLPFTTVTAGAADYVVRTAVKLFCPGYTSRTN